MTKRAKTRFRIAEGASGQPWIVLEPLGGDDLAMFRENTLVGFDLPTGTSLEEAELIAVYLNRHLTHVSET